MAGDWLKFEANTPDKPEVFAITVAMGWDDPDLTVGKLIKVWRWFDQHTIDGNAQNVTLALLDRVSGVTGFSKAMSDAGWLIVDERSVRLPKFDRHNGKTAKERAQNAKRVAAHKAKNGCEPDGNDEGNGATVSEALPREEKRREEKKESQKQKTIAPAYSAEAALCEAGVDPQVAADWLQVRKAKKSKPTKTGIDGVLQNIAKAGMTADQGIRLCCERGWAGFNADWLTPQQARASPGGAWWATDQSIIAKGAEMGMQPRAGEPMPAFKGRVQAAIDNGGKEPPPPRQQIVTAADIDDRKGMKPVGLDLKALIRPRAET